MNGNKGLRKRADAIARGKTALSRENIEAMTPEEIQRMLHELQVHQIELEMQNDELRRTQAELEAARARYFDFYELAPVGYFTLAENGMILEANLTTATLLGMAREALVKQPITRFIHKEDQDIFYLHRKQLFATGEPQTCELRMVKNDGTAFWAHLAATVAQDADGAPVCRLVLSDITERRFRENERELISRLIVLINTPGDFSERHVGPDRFPARLVGVRGRRHPPARRGRLSVLRNPWFSARVCSSGKTPLRLRPGRQDPARWHRQSRSRVHVRQRPVRPVRSRQAVLHRPWQLLVQQHHRPACQHHRSRPPGAHAQPVQWQGL